MFPTQLRPLFLTILSLTLHSVVSGALVNITVDDSQTEDGSTIIQYTPTELWNVGTDCSGCTAHPDSTRTLDGTWHDSTHEQGAGADGLPLATLQFEGSGIYVYCTVAHTATSPDGNSDMTFFIDGQTMGSFELPPTGQADYDYNILVYANSSIPPGSHTFVLQNGRPGGAKSLVLLDYIAYTHDDNTLPTPLSSTTTLASSPTPPLSVTAPQTTQSSILSTSNIGPTSATSATASDLSHLTSSSGLGISSATSSRYSTLGRSLSSTSTRDQPSVVITPPLSISNSPAIAAAGTSSHSSTLGRTRTIILASVIPGGVLFGIVALAVWWRRRAQYEYYAPATRGIGEDPTTSGWTSDAWAPKGDVGAGSNHGHSNHGHDSPSNVSRNDQPVRSGKAADTVGRSRGLTISSAVTAASSAYSASAYSRSSFGSSVPMHTTADHPALPSQSDTGASSTLGYAAQSESGKRARHPYATRTPEPYDSADETAALSTVPEQSSPEQSSAASHENAPRDLAAPPMQTAVVQPEQASNTESQSSLGRRPFPDRPVLEHQAQAARFRRFFRTPSGSSDMPPAYDDLSERGRESLPGSIRDTKL
ncbi:uncharacterized protein PHACADRAFT_168032 [Phanerochaete carnosa HHB-10118-sp]|uniref:Uncharacterized protein n=1 Tax=Phanerochaete carnosa (strain HHB-10118-sp) TaxID=650164 RepID=K5XCK0_PHACS|nr:uncharacterized protein PHACADRAFT_168032 [Phanerochaete carnosa HHB-10118-sp]EKM60717.1 hypothetical protein PHACADRAFT_168032 [Phanerochaete carnosa HHB-10118-sp]